MRLRAYSHKYLPAVVVVGLEGDGSIKSGGGETQQERRFKHEKENKSEGKLQEEHRAGSRLHESKVRARHFNRLQLCL